eukprot:1194779-Prorocentrum_minimum.AAC.4
MPVGRRPTILGFRPTKGGIFCRCGPIGRGEGAYSVDADQPGEGRGHDSTSGSGCRVPAQGSPVESGGGVFIFTKPPPSSCRYIFSYLHELVVGEADEGPGHGHAQRRAGEGHLAQRGPHGKAQLGVRVHRAHKVALAQYRHHRARAAHRRRLPHLWGPTRPHDVLHPHHLPKCEHKQINNKTK